MSHGKKQHASASKVSDKRRFDPEGNPRKFSKDEFVGGEDTTQGFAKETPFEETETPPPAPAQETCATPSNADELVRLQSELKAAHARVDTLARAYQELEHDKENFKQRLQREHERTLELEKGKVALLLIEAVDELELCLKNADDSPLSVGVKMIHENILKKLKDNFVVSLELKDTVFDPNLAEAVDLQMVDNPEDNMKILEVLRPAYVFKEQVIRPARVRVARHVPPAEA